MKKILCVCLALCLLLTSACGASSYADDYSYDYTEEATEPSFDYETCSMMYANMLEKYPASCRLIFSSDDPLLYMEMEADRFVCLPDNTYVLQYSSEEAAMKAEQKLYASGKVDYVEPDVVMTGQDFYSWGAMDMGVDLFATGMAAYQTMTPVIAVVDSGVNDHEMIGTMKMGWDFLENDAFAQDEHGHGTHVAGIISDMMGNFDHTIIPLRVLDENKRGYSGNIALAVRYAVDHGAQVINLSLGGEHSSCLEEAIEYAIYSGCSVVVAAGNSSRDVYYQCPAHMPGVVTVSSVDSAYNLAINSNFGNGVDICAPGVGILSASHTGGYVEGSGTSMAAPHISGILALLLASNAAETTYEAECVLFDNCIDLGEEGRDFKYGWGYPDMTQIGDLVLKKNTPADYWILGVDCSYPYDVAHIEFYTDGTYLITDLATGGVSAGEYAGLGDQQLTLWENEPIYFMGSDFFDNTGDRYETSSTYTHPDGITGPYTLTHCSGVHPYSDTPAPTYATEPYAPEPTTEPAKENSGAPAGGTMNLSDGTYYVDFYLDSIRSNGGGATLTVDFLGIIELSGSEVSSLTPGTYYGNGFTLNVEYVSFSSANGVDYVEINGWEYGEYIPSRDVWRFKTVNDLPLHYYVTTGDILISSNAVIWDYLTPFIFGQNAIGMQEGDFMQKDDSFYRTASIVDFCEWHEVMSPYMEHEKAYVTVQNNAVTTMTIPAHP